MVKESKQPQDCSAT